MSIPALEVHDLVVGFPTPSGSREVVHGVDLRIERGEIVALVGESGSGKSLVGLACLALTPPPGHILSGSVQLEGRNLLELSQAVLRSVRGGEIGIVLQEPLASFDPRWTMQRHLDDVLIRHTTVSAAERRQRRQDLLELVALPRGRLDAFAHELSGGERQRFMIALALAGEPKFLIADEPTSALDTTVRAQIADLIVDLRDRLGLGVLLMSHDFGLVGRVADRVYVVHAGRVVEAGPCDLVLAQSRHPYTRLLRDAIGWFDDDPSSLSRAASSPVDTSSVARVGCSFSARCPLVQEQCRRQRPNLESFGPDHQVACWMADA